jgi:hypothetical protein
VSQRGFTTRDHHMMKPVMKSSGGTRPRISHATRMPRPPKLPTCSGATQSMTMSPALRAARGDSFSTSPV